MTGISSSGNNPNSSVNGAASSGAASIRATSNLSTGPQSNERSSLESVNPLLSMKRAFGEAIAPFSRYSANSTLVPALMNTPITTSLYRPLVVSQHTGRQPHPALIFSTTGWTESIGRTGIRYIIADTSRVTSARALYGVNYTGQLPEQERFKADLAVNTSASFLMTLASQPLTALQIGKQLQSVGSQNSADTKNSADMLKRIAQNPFRGSAGNYLATNLMFALDSNDRDLIKRNKEGKLSNIELAGVQMGLGSFAGVANNFLKIHANGRAVGRSHTEIFDHIRTTAKRNPTVFLAQIGYATVKGGVANKLWGSSIWATKELDHWVQSQRAQQPESPENIETPKQSGQS